MIGKFRASDLGFPIAFQGFLFLCPMGTGFADGIPMAILRGLSSDKFPERETAQADLKEWAGKRPAKSVDELYRQWLSASDPEVKVRCLAVLKDLVIEREFRGEGYLGISMIEMSVQIPGDDFPRRAIEIGMVMPGTAAAAAGLLPKDLIVGLGDKIWKERGMDADFARRIREMRPGTEITLLLLRDDKVVREKIRIGIKPDRFDGEEGDAAENARDRFFQRWLDKRETDRR